MSDKSDKSDKPLSDMTVKEILDTAIEVAKEQRTNISEAARRLLSAAYRGGMGNKKFAAIVTEIGQFGKPRAECSKVLVVHEKHGDRIFDASTAEKLFAAALMIVGERAGQGWYDPGTAPTKPGLELDCRAAQELKETCPSSYAELRRSHEDYDIHRLNWERNNRTSIWAKEAVAGKNGALAWKVLLRDSDSEYSRVELVSPEVVK